MQPNLREVFVATGLYIVLVLASVAVGEPDLAGVATFTLVPLALLLGLRADLPARDKLASIGLPWYLAPLLGSLLWTVRHPGHPIAFLVGTLCLMIFFLSAAFLVRLYLVERRALGRGLQPEDGSSGLHGLR